ncbi:MAG: carboxypeptidase-like regulatory domain-containing protein [Leeuwenhoekiella sp.]
MKFYFPLLLIFSTAILSAQNIKLTGTVKDSLGTPLELANVIATKTSDGAMESYGISNTSGYYQFSLPSGEKYTIVASFLGLAPTTKEVDLTEANENQTLDFVLFPAADQLNDVELIYEMPVVVRGDTIVYNTDSFTNGTEQKLGDVLKKLPGVTVTDDGEIEVEGQRVQKVMIEGKDFFDGDSKLATKNIPADALSKVEVLKNYNEVDQMRGLGNDQGNIAINLKLKEGKENFWFGEVQGGLGASDRTRYLGSAKLFYYSPKTSINFIGNSNNTGDVPFTFRDYFNFTGGFRNFNSRGGTSFNISDSGLGFLITQNDRANEIEADFAAANFSIEASEALDLSGFTIFSDNQTDFVQRTLTQYIGTGATENRSDNSTQRNRLAMGKFSGVYKPNARLQMDYDLIARASDQSEFGDLLSVVTDSTITSNPITEIKDNQPYSINQNLNAYYTLSEKHIFAGYAQHLLQQDDPLYNAIVTLQPFAQTIPLDMNQSNFDINQDKLLKSSKFDSRIDYYYIINDKSNINFSVGTTLSRQDFNTSIFQRLDNGSILDFNQDQLANDVRYNFSDYFVGAHYKFKEGLFTFTPGVTLHSYQVKTVQQNVETKDSPILLLPDLFAIAELKKSESIRFNYRMTADFSDVNNFAEGFVFNNYNRLNGGNALLQNGIFHNVSLNYFNFNMFNFTNINGGVSYNRRVDAIKTRTLIDQINQVSIPINSAEVDETFSANGRFQKTFKKFKANLSANVNYSDLFNIVNTRNGNTDTAEVYRNSQSFTQTYRGSLETNFKNAPNFEVGYSFTKNDYDNGGVVNTFFTDRPFANVQLIFLKDFTFTADWNYYNYRSDDDRVQNEYAFFEASLFYKKKDSPWEFRIDGTNLLDVESLNRDNFNDNFSSTSEYFVMPRIVLFSVRYNL